MKKTKCIIRISVDETQQNIKISGLIVGKDIDIPYASDINFTPLVSAMAEHIDTGEEISLTINMHEGTENAKLKLVTDTIMEIVNKYNENLEKKDEDTDRE